MSLWPIAYAATQTSIPVLEKIKQNILNPLILLLSALALMYFLYGVYEMISNADNEEARKQGQQHVLWGVVGLFILISARGILNVICRTITAC